MKELITCKSCGYIMDKGKLRDKCPACGVSAKMFIPYTDPISVKRRFILSLDMHPVMVHFPQAFSGFLLVLSLASFVLPGDIRSKIAASVFVIAAVFPLTILGAFIAGIIDGKTRFRKTKTPILIRKMVVGGLFFLFSCGIAIVVLTSPSFSTFTAAVTTVLSGACLVCATFLGLWGTSLLNAKFPG